MILLKCLILNSFKVDHEIMNSHHSDHTTQTSFNICKLGLYSSYLQKWPEQGGVWCGFRRSPAHKNKLEFAGIFLRSEIRIKNRDEKWPKLICEFRRFGPNRYSKMASLPSPSTPPSAIHLRPKVFFSATVFPAVLKL